MRRSIVLVCLILMLGCGQPPQPGVHPPVCPIPVTPPVQPPHVEPCSRPRVLAFCAEWCVPCKRAQPTLARLEAAGVEVVHVNIDERPDLVAQYGVTSVPTFFVYVCGKDVVRTQDVNVVVQCMTWLKGIQDGTTSQTPLSQLP